MLLPNRTAYSRTFLIFFSHSSILAFHCIAPLLVDGHSSFHMLLFNSGMIRCSLACPSQSDGHDVPSLSVGLSDILIFVSVTELFFFRPSSLLPFPGEASHTYFFRRKVSANRILQVPDALFLEFFQKLFAVRRASNKNFSWPIISLCFHHGLQIPIREQETH